MRLYQFSILIFSRFLVNIDGMILDRRPSNPASVAATHLNEGSPNHVYRIWRQSIWWLRFKDVYWNQGISIKLNFTNRSSSTSVIINREMHYPPNNMGMCNPSVVRYGVNTTTQFCTALVNPWRVARTLMTSKSQVTSGRNALTSAQWCR